MCQGVLGWKRASSESGNEASTVVGLPLNEGTVNSQHLFHQETEKDLVEGFSSARGGYDLAIPVSATLGRVISGHLPR